ncbi:hypothetical protein ABIE45_004574 [Methylobacterium sp. OAE515]|uniref:hypothetical protein n=1 Tax=Methylobacterium sp. OAE515 TaxID=2817895 RepID=UPI0017893AD9
MGAKKSIVPMSAVEAYAALKELRSEIGPKAYVTISITASDHREAPVYASIYAGGIGQTSPNFSCNGDDIGEVVAALRAGWAGFQEEHARRMTADMALEIIRITDEQGCCTDAALRGSKFSVGDVLRFGSAACAKANEMAGRGPFEIVSIAGANGEAA